MSNRRLTIPLLALALAPAACGGSGEPASTTTTVARAPAAKAPKIPPELLGTWSTTLREGDIPAQFALNNPFSVRISRDGGVDGAPAFAIGTARRRSRARSARPCSTATR